MTTGHPRWASPAVGPVEGPSFVPPGSFTVPPDALRRLLRILVAAANRHERTAAG